MRSISPTRRKLVPTIAIIFHKINPAKFIPFDQITERKLKIIFGDIK